MCMMKSLETARLNLPTQRRRAVGAVAAVMVIGLLLFTLDSTASAQIVASASLNVERAGHSATRLVDGRILIAGGENAGGTLSTAEVYDPATQRFSIIVGNLAFSRAEHTATLLSDGRVLLAGGRQTAAEHAHGNPGASTVLTSTEVFCPRTDSFSSGPAS